MLAVAALASGAAMLATIVFEVAPVAPAAPPPVPWAPAGAKAMKAAAAAARIRVFMSLPSSERVGIIGLVMEPGEAEQAKEADPVPVEALVLSGGEPLLGFGRDAAVAGTGLLRLARRCEPDQGGSAGGGQKGAFQTGCHRRTLLGLMTRSLVSCVGGRRVTDGPRHCSAPAPFLHPKRMARPAARRAALHRERRSRALTAAASG